MVRDEGQEDRRALLRKSQLPVNNWRFGLRMKPNRLRIRARILDVKKISRQNPVGGISGAGRTKVNLVHGVMANWDVRPTHDNQLLRSSGEEELTANDRVQRLT
jgi:hypothetical protein